MSYEDGGMPAGGNSRFRGYPARMSERQQLALLLQMTSQEITSGTSNRSESSAPVNNARSSPLQHQKNSKSRWSNKNADLLDVNSSYNRQDERMRLMNGCDAKDRNAHRRAALPEEFAGSSSPDEVRQATRAESPVAAGSPAECAATVISSAGAPPPGPGPRHHQEGRTEQHQHQHQQQQVVVEAAEAARVVGLHLLEHSEAGGAAYEMRRTPPQNKADRQATGGGGGQQQQPGGGGGGGGSTSSSTSNSAGSTCSGSSPRVTLRLNQVRATRDEKKGAGTGAGGLGSSGAAPTAGGIVAVGGQAVGGGASCATVGPAGASSRQGIVGGGSAAGTAAASMNTSQMEATSTKPSGGGGGIASSTTASSSSSVGVGGPSGIVGSSVGSNSASSSSLGDVGDVYEFKSSKEATPVRGSSSSPNPNLDKDGNEAASSSMAMSTGGGQGQNVNSSANGAGSNISSSGSSGAMGSNTITSSDTASSTSGSAVVGSSSSSSNNTGPGSSTEALAASIGSSITDEQMMTTSPSSSGAIVPSSSAKRTFDSENSQDDQDEESRKRKKKDNESCKDVSCVKGVLSGRQTTNRSNSSIIDKCAKSGKQATGTISAKGGQITTSLNIDHKSPSSSLNANSPKPSNSSATSASNNTKGSASASAESDGEDDRSKNSDCNSAPKVPPLKIVIPQSTTSEQEQGNRNGKNTSNRGHQLPYVVASSNSNDSVEKDQSTSAVISGTTSPLDNSNMTSKNDEKKEISASLDNESRSTHHQRVLRSSHRSGNGGNGSSSTRESSNNMAGNGNYSNSSPLPTGAVDRSNNSSPQQRHHSPTPESSGICETGKSLSTDLPVQNSPIGKSNALIDKCEKSVEMKKDTGDTLDSAVKKESGTEIATTSSQVPVELHPRKRKMKTSKEAQQAAATAAASETTETASTGPEIHPHDQPITNCYQLFLNIRKQIERRRKCLFPVQPKPPQGFKDYLMNRCTYVLAGNANEEPNINPPVSLMGPMKDLYIEQEKERYRLRMQHVVEKEKLVLSVEQEILRVHGRAARALANQSLPFSVCTILKDEEVYNVITPEQEEKDRNARSRYNGRLFLSWLQDVDDKWEKIKEAMLLRHHNEAESLHAVQRMDWEWKLKEVGLCEFKVTPQIEDLHVPMVHVSDDFDLLPA